MSHSRINKIIKKENAERVNCEFKSNEFSFQFEQ